VDLNAGGLPDAGWTGSFHLPGFGVFGVAQERMVSPLPPPAPPLRKRMKSATAPPIRFFVSAFATQPPDLRFLRDEPAGDPLRAQSPSSMF
jgi:hypothetical protein